MIRVQLGFILARDAAQVKDQAMVSLALSMVVYIRAFFVPRHQLALEVDSTLVMASW